MSDPASAVAVPLDPLVVHPGRLSILLALSAGGDGGAEFVDLRRRTRMTDGNLASHAKRLSAGGLVGVDKRFRDGRPVTTFLLTPAGRHALRTHVDGLVSAIAGPAMPAGPVLSPNPSSDFSVPRTPAPGPVSLAGSAADDDDDWID
ncbi:MAG: ArsR family transcriptional regulator [Phycisphaerales bacterium]|nr:ArsR family transcriptional regulator [Phycisphaerales bacterium]